MPITERERSALKVFEMIAIGRRRGSKHSEGSLYAHFGAKVLSLTFGSTLASFLRNSVSGGFLKQNSNGLSLTKKGLYTLNLLRAKFSRWHFVET